MDDRMDDDGALKTPPSMYQYVPVGATAESDEEEDGVPAEFRASDPLEESQGLPVTFDEPSSYRAGKANKVAAESTTPTEMPTEESFVEKEEMAAAANGTVKVMSVAVAVVTAYPKI